MPFKSAKQKRFMEGISHGMKPYAKDAPSKDVADEFIKADKMSKSEDITADPKKFRRNPKTRVSG